ncbi:MAG TPA: hypothetical protein VMU87_06515 [Stellaceae bacterium]|nr:hypothetical protein [Stellaceae bacterium]
MNANIEIKQISNQIQKRLAQQTAALQAAPDSAMTTPLQAQITTLQSQSSTMSTIASNYGANANTIFDLQNQLAALQTDAANGDSASFDATLATANNDAYNLAVINLVPPLQPDGVATLKANGLGIGASSVYNLSTPAGQSSAAAAIQNAQNVVGQVSQITTSNQIVASSMSSALTNQVDSLNSQLQHLQQNTDTQTTAEIAKLTQQAQEQEHLIELAIGNTQLVSSALMQAENPPQPTRSPLGALSSAVGATVSSYQSQQSSPAILSLLT